MNIRTLIITLFLFVSSVVAAQENKVIKGFSGGMMVHTVATIPLGSTSAVLPLASADVPN